MPTGPHAPTPDIDRRLATAIDAAHAGGRAVLPFFRADTGANEKAEGDLVTNADLAAERTILELLRDAFPGEPVMSEESHAATRGAEHLWIVDPLDGTNNFAHGIAHFAISVGYYHQGQPTVGAVLNPVSRELYTAARGAGAERNGTPIRVTPETELARCLIATGFYYDRGDAMRATLDQIEALFRSGVHGVRRFGAAALDLCAVASGSYAAFFEHRLAPWDFAAGRLIVEEAGGRITDYRGNPLTTEPSSVLATNAILHDEMTRRLRATPGPTA
jgi:myo-inositol-1(or 4)-monophosphatase